MIKKLPHWVLTDIHPSFYDLESVTAIEMVAKLYGKMEELVSDYNTFVDNVNKEIENFETSINKDFDNFKLCIQNLVNNYIEMIDTKMNLQDEKIDAAINYMKVNIIQTATDLFNQALIEGTIRADLITTYDAQTESLTIDLDLVEVEEGE